MNQCNSTGDGNVSLARASGKQYTQSVPVSCPPLNAKIAKCVALPGHKSCVVYLNKKNNKISARSQTVATARIAPKVCHGQLPTFVSQHSKFHPNRFTFGGVIAGRVKAVKTSLTLISGADRLLPSLRPRRSLSAVCVNRRQTGTVACKLYVFW